MLIFVVLYFSPYLLFVSVCIIIIFFFLYALFSSDSFCHLTHISSYCNLLNDAVCKCLGVPIWYYLPCSDSDSLNMYYFFLYFPYWCSLQAMLWITNCIVYLKFQLAHSSYVCIRFIFYFNSYFNWLVPLKRNDMLYCYFIWVVGFVYCLLHYTSLDDSCINACFKENCSWKWKIWRWTNKNKINSSYTSFFSSARKHTHTHTISDCLKQTKTWNF